MTLNNKINKLRKNYGFKKLKCQDCGSINNNVHYTDADDGGIWISIDCNKCGHAVFYNGA